MNNVCSGIIRLLKSIGSLLWWDGLNFMVQSVMDNFSVLDVDLVLNVSKSTESMLHPVGIVSVWVVVSGVGTSGLSSNLSRLDGLLCVQEEVVKFEGLNQVGVPDFSLVANLNVLIHLRDFFELLNTIIQKFLVSEDSGVSLHGLLHLRSELGSWLSSGRESQVVEHFDSLFSSVSLQFFLGLAWLEVLNSGVSGSSSEDN